MEWTNIFDAGPCTVEVWTSGGAPRFIAPSEYAGLGLTVVVIEGEVVVSGNGAAMEGLIFVVRADFPTDNSPVRILDVQTQDVPDYYTPYSTDLSSSTPGDNPHEGWMEQINISVEDWGQEIYTYTPDPATFTPTSEEHWTLVCVSMRESE